MPPKRYRTCTSAFPSSAHATLRRMCSVLQMLKMRLQSLKLDPSRLPQAGDAPLSSCIEITECVLRQDSLLGSKPTTIASSVSACGHSCTCTGTRWYKQIAMFSSQMPMPRRSGLSAACLIDRLQSPARMPCPKLQVRPFPLCVPDC